MTDAADATSPDSGSVGRVAPSYARAQLEAILEIASRTLFSHLDAFWPTHRKWDVHEANLVAHLHGASLARGHRAYTEVPIQVPRTKRIDLLVVPATRAGGDHLLWTEAKRVYASKQGKYILSDIQRLIDPRCRLGDVLHDRLQEFPCAAAFVAVTHRPVFASWWAQPLGSPPEFAGDAWVAIGDILSRASARLSYAHPAGRPRPSYMLAALWPRERT